MEKDQSVPIPAPPPPPTKSRMDLVRCLECERRRQKNIFIAKDRNFLNVHVEFHVGEEKNQIRHQNPNSAAAAGSDAELVKEIWRRCFGADFDLEPDFGSDFGSNLGPNFGSGLGSDKRVTEFEFDPEENDIRADAVRKNSIGIGNPAAGIPISPSRQSGTPSGTSTEWLRLQIVREMKKRATSADPAGKSSTVEIRQ